MSLTEILMAATQSDAAIRMPAETQLETLSKSNFPQYIGSLTAELGNDSTPTNVRQLAGLLLKNSLISKNEQLNKKNAERWMETEINIRNQIKSMMLSLLSNNDKAVRNTVSLVIAKIAAIEIPRNQWADLISILVKIINDSNSSSNLKQSTFETLGYVCEELPDSLSQHSNLILNAIASGMSSNAKSEIKLSATNALANALDFIKENFSNKTERDQIMRMIFDVIINSSKSEYRIKVAAFQCLVETASSYYEYLSEYMTPIFSVTSEAIQQNIQSKDPNDGCEEVSQQAIEFWSSVCDQELIAIDDAAYAKENPSEKIEIQIHSQNFIEKAAPHLIPLLLNSLTKQNEEVDDDTWNTAQAAGTCLGLCAQVVGEGISIHVLPFVQSNIQNSNWRFKEAAILSFGAMLSCVENPLVEEREGQSSPLGDLVQQAFPLILNNLSDPMPLIKDTSAWTIGRICNLLPETVTPFLPQLMKALIHGLSDVPRVASNICWAIHNLAEHNQIDEKTNSSAMSPYFQPLIEALLRCTTRPDVSEANLLSSTYEAINVLITNSAPDTHSLINQITPLLIERLQHTLNSNTLSTTEREYANEIQALLCGAIQVVIQKLEDSQILPFTDTLMRLFLEVLQSKNSTVHEEALMAIGAIATRTGIDFQKYVSHLQPYLIQGLNNTNEWKVCLVSVGLVGDISRALETHFIPLSDDVMRPLLEHLRSAEIERSIKPQIISTIGDIALAVGGYFERYLAYTMPMLVQASQLSLNDFDAQDPDSHDYLNSLREAVFEAFTGILQGLASERKAPLFLSISGASVHDIVLLFDRVVSDSHPDDSVIRAAAGFIGDMASRLGTGVLPALIRRESVAKIIGKASQSSNSSTAEAGNWAAEVLMKIGQGQNL